MDQKLFFLINRDWANPGLDRLMALFSSAAFWSVPLAAMALAALIWGGFRGRTFVLLALVTFGMTDGVIGRGLKKAVNRPRPNQAMDGARMLDLASPAWKGVLSPLKEKVSRKEKNLNGGNSFPSNHSANTAAVATVAMLIWPWGWLALLPALLVAYSRVYVGSHWPTDTLAGTGIGMLTAVGVFLLASWAWRKWAPRFFPNVYARHPSLRFAA